MYTWRTYTYMSLISVTYLCHFYMWCVFKERNCEECLNFIASVHFICLLLISLVKDRIYTLPAVNIYAVQWGALPLCSLMGRIFRFLLFLKLKRSCCLAVGVRPWLATCRQLGTEQQFYEPVCGVQLSVITASESC